MTCISRIIFIILLSATLISGVSAYTITLSAPNEINLGSPLIITGDTTFPEDTYFDIVLFYSKYTAGELARQKVIVDQSKQFRTEFETRDLKKGQYKIEVHNIVFDGKEFVENSLGSSSVTRRVVTIVDRSDEVAIESPGSQDLLSALTVTGRVKDMGNGVITLRAFGPEDFTFGPLQLITSPGFADKDGHFSTKIPVTLGGEYQISISDKDGFIGEFSFNVTGGTNATQTASITPTSTLPPKPLETVATQPQTPLPTPTKSPLPDFIGICSFLSAYLLYRRE
ncbi:MAG: hypothetical protein LUQ50_05635 [Methanospirillum sp.]|uniref:hypothetical protein n=1 Tax=Methanospirillum sp. TaxID=45200 RepID=UPI00236CB3E6|nr:hypothetical protein [Methanospirillum sp.]MDD1728533.1 hypothetical protein [Methanospirillum sp.]